MQTFLQQVLDGIASGALYGAMALSLVLVFRASGIVNFAQGEMAMISAYLTWQLHTWGLPLIAAILVAVGVAFLAGALMERFLIRPFGTSKEGHLSLIIVTLGVMLALNSAAGWIWGYLTKTIPPTYGQGTVSFAGASISRQAAGTLLTVAVLAALLFWVFQKTRLGLEMRAASSNPDSARLSGIPVSRMLLLGWGIAAAIGAVVGALVAPQLYLQPNMMATMLLYAFAAAILGGFDSPVGALIGGLIVGVTENLAGTYVDLIGNDFKQAVAVLIIMIVLLFRPQGLFGSKEVARV
jgi:branched-chain amino acid transport system permease protein